MLNQLFVFANNLIPYIAVLPGVAFICLDKGINDSTYPVDDHNNAQGQHEPFQRLQRRYQDHYSADKIQKGFERVLYIREITDRAVFDLQKASVRDNEQTAARQSASDDKQRLILDKNKSEYRSDYQKDIYTGSLTAEIPIAFI